MEFEETKEEDLSIPKTSPENHCVLEKCDSDYVYLKVLVKNSSKTELDREPVLFKNFLLKSITKNFGEMNCLVPVDIIKYDHITNEVILRCNSRIFQRLASSILLNNSKLSYLKILQISYNNPLSLMFSSRSYSHCSKNSKKRKKICYN